MLIALVCKHLKFWTIGRQPRSPRNPRLEAPNCARATRVPRAPPPFTFSFCGEPMDVLKLYADHSCNAVKRRCMTGWLSRPRPVGELCPLGAANGTYPATRFWRCGGAMPPYRITVALSHAVPSFLVQACQSWHWYPGLKLPWPAIARATQDRQHWGGLQHWLHVLLTPGLQQVSPAFTSEGAHYLAMFGILIAVMWAPSLPPAQEQQVNC